MRPTTLTLFVKELETWLATLRPVLLYHELFGGSMTVCLLQGDGAQVVALDLFVETADEVQVTKGKTRVLLNRGQLTQVSPNPPKPASLQRDLDVEIRYFWRLFAMLPSLERDELIPAALRLSQEVAQVVNVCSLGRGRPRDVGEKASQRTS